MSVAIVQLCVCVFFLFFFFFCLYAPTPNHYNLPPLGLWMDGYFVYRRSTLKGHIASNKFYVI